MEIQGKIIAALEPVNGTSQRTGNAWAKQEFVLETHDQYPKKCCFTVFGQEKLLSFAQTLAVGNDVVVSFDIDSHEYNGKWYNSIMAWKVTPAVQDASNGVFAEPAVQSAPEPVAQPVPAPAAVEIPAPARGGDELPF